MYVNPHRTREKNNQLLLCVGMCVCVVSIFDHKSNGICIPSTNQRVTTAYFYCALFKFLFRSRHHGFGKHIHTKIQRKINKFSLHFGLKLFFLCIKKKNKPFLQKIKINFWFYSNNIEIRKMKFSTKIINS